MLDHLRTGIDGLQQVVAAPADDFSFAMEPAARHCVGLP